MTTRQWAWLNTKLCKRADGVRTRDFTTLYETVEMVYACMDFAGGMCNGILKWICACKWKCAGYHNLDLFAPALSSFSSFHPSFHHPSHEPFYLETLVLQPSYKNISIRKPALQRYNLGSWTLISVLRERLVLAHKYNLKFPQNIVCVAQITKPIITSLGSHKNI